MGHTITIKPTVKPKKSSNAKLLWTVSGNLNDKQGRTIASIDENGRLTARASGRVTVTAYAQDGSRTKGTCTVYIGKAISKLKIKNSSINSKRLVLKKAAGKGKLTLKKGSVKTLKVEVFPRKAS